MTKTKSPKATKSQAAKSGVKIKTNVRAGDGPKERIASNHNATKVRR